MMSHSGFADESLDDVAKAAVVNEMDRFKGSVRDAVRMRNLAVHLDDFLKSEFSEAAQRLNLRVSPGAAHLSRKTWFLKHTWTQEVLLLGRALPDGGLEPAPETPELLSIRQRLNDQVMDVYVATKNFMRVGGRPIVH